MFKIHTDRMNSEDKKNVGKEYADISLKIK